MVDAGREATAVSAATGDDVWAGAHRHQDG